MSNAEHSDYLGAVAIVGMAGRFPGARNLEEFWRNLRDGVESISFYSEEELLAAGVEPGLLKDPNYVRAGAVLPGVELFDAPFFGFTPREAELTDPQHRLLLECAWEALEDAAYRPGECRERVGVYAGASTSTYVLNIHSEPGLAASAGALQIEIGNDKDHLATRVSYKLNLKGPGITVQTGCSTSLVAVHLACQGLLDHECDMALAGGVSVSSYRPAGYLYQKGGVRSPDGHCRAFDAGAAGTVAGSGVGVVALKRLGDAVADGDHIHAIIRATAVNNDGAAKVGYTAPSVDGQAEVITKALALAGVTPDGVTYVEAHGTGTHLGDPVEVAALTKSFRAGTDKKRFCAIGSVKTNIGHLNVAAGVAGLIKSVLSLKHRTLPPSLHFERPNPNMELDDGPFYVSARLAPWPTDGPPRRAGVSSFSIGGTNAHVILEEPPAPEPCDARRDVHLLTLSARTETALKTLSADLATHLRQNPETNTADLAYTLQVGRKRFGCRRAFVCRDVRGAIEGLEAGGVEWEASCEEDGGAERRVAFMFAGQGVQHVGMGRELYQAEPAFRAEVDRCSELLAPALGLDLRDALYAPEGEDPKAAERLGQTFFAQPALFVTEYALARLWMGWGVCPSAMIGHSIGEYVAACLSGVMSLEDALSLVAERGRLMQRMPEGAMLAVALPEEEVVPLLGHGLSLAAVNGPASCVVSGPAEALGGLELRLGERGLLSRRLNVSHAFHSRMMEPIVEAFARQAARVELRPPEIPYLSNVTGSWVTAAEATDPLYWGRHLRQTVRFSAGVAELLKEPGRVLLEIGPGQTLCALARQCSGKDSARLALPSLRRPREPVSDVESMLGTLGHLWRAGAFDRWEDFYAGERRLRIPLPTYPFEKERFWVEGRRGLDGDAPRATLERAPDVADWLYAPLWRQSVAAGNESASSPRTPSPWLVFVDESGLGAQVVRQLEEAGEAVVAVEGGERFAERGGGLYTIDARRAGDYRRLLEEVSARGGAPARIVHLWSVRPPAEELSAVEAYEVSLRRGYQSLLFLAQALGDRRSTEPVSVVAVSNNLHNVVGGDASRPEQATLLGVCKVIPKEYPHVTCRSVDVVLPAPQAGGYAETAARLIAELSEESAEAVVALRGDYRWVQTFEPLKPTAAGPAPGRVRRGGVYLLTGVWSEIGFAVAEHLVKEFDARLVVVDDSAFPPRAEWERRLGEAAEETPLRRKMRMLLSLEAGGAETQFFTADVTDAQEMRKVVEQAAARWGEIHGVFHMEDRAQHGLIQLKSQQEPDRGFDAKVKGALVMEAALKEHPLDFLVLFSSATSIAPGFGQVAECAANAFLDALAQARYRGRRAPVVAVNWTAWRTPERPEVAAEGGAQQLQSSLRQEQDRYGLTPREGVEALFRILSLRAPQAVVSTRDFRALVERLHSLTTADAVRALGRLRSSEPAHARPALDADYAAPRGAVEKILAEIWQELFGIERVGVHDDFIHLGGHSLLAIQLVTRVREAFQIDLPLTDLFAAPTIARLSEKITAQQLTPEEVEEIESIYSEIEGLSTSDVQRQLVEELRRIDGEVEHGSIL
ncbi:MAG TPA: beta-ketoacyl synthase N-terminal-like domain-containing protein [Pyrinomonadaceae bacterium]|jgi:acyl transferase domain-containing protein